MKIITASSGKKTVKISKAEWLSIGKKAGWMKSIKACDEVTESQLKEVRKDEEQEVTTEKQLEGKQVGEETTLTEDQLKSVRK